MIGMAKQLFIEKEGFSPWREKRPSQWPLLEKGEKLGCFSYVDYAFAEMLLRDFPETSELGAAFLCHLSRSCREGHICVQVDGDKINPSPMEMWFAEIDKEKIGDLFNLAEGLAAGVSDLPESLISNTAATPLFRDGNLYYFQKYWLLESLFVKNFQRLLASTPALEISIPSINSQQLNPQQCAAIQNALKSSLSVICGGPGTGKTYTAGYLIKLFWESLDQEQKQQCEICLAAPTGKAASNLQRSLQQATANIEGFKLLKAKTLHSLLGIRGAGFSPDASPKPLTADLILVDESSMIDVRVMAMLFSAVKSGARLVLLGDRFQLPPVEAGSMFADMIASLQLDGSVTELITCLRAERQTLIDFASAINAGNSNTALELLNDPANVDCIEWIHVSEEGERPRHIQERLVNYAAALFPSSGVGKEEPVHLLEDYNRFRILTPLRSGFFGVDEINRQLLNRMMQRVKKEAWYAVPIMIIANDYKMELFNGEVGVLVRQRRHDIHVSEGDYALFPREQKNYRKVPAVLLPKYEYAYCLSVHKSQGSEFDRVLMLLPKGSEVFGREVLYTAATRAKKKLEVWGKAEVLTQTLAKSSVRVSGLGHNPGF